MTQNRGQKRLFFGQLKRGCMKRLVLIGAIAGFATSGAWGVPKDFLEFGTKGYKPDQSRWQFDVAVNYLEYPVDLPEFEGEHYTARSPEKYPVFGPGLSIGREFYIGGGLSTDIKIGAFYFKTLDTAKGQATEDIDIELASKKSLHQIAGGSASMSINYVIEGKSVDYQPFVMAGLSSGSTRIEKNYKFEGIQSDKSDKESYVMVQKDKFIASEVGIGMNFISKKGIIFTIKASQTALSFTERKLEGEYQNAGESVVEIESDDKTAKTVNSASLGVGFAF